MSIDIKYNYLEDEKEEQERWYNSNIYYWNKEQHQNLDFVIDTPPPTVSGYLHMGHVFSYCQTDFIARYQRMCGKNVFYPIGFDDNGLPTERLVEKTHKVKGSLMNKQGKKQEFIDLCYGVVNEAEKEFEKLFKTLGISYDWRQKYQTIANSTQDLVIDTFNKLKSVDLAYQKEGPVYWDVVDQTALAQSIIEDKEIDGAEHYLIWDVLDENGNKIEGEKGHATIMTTRPELLPACVAVFYNPNDERFKYLEGKYMQFSNITEKVPCLSDEAVKMDKGTGLVMCCTYGDWQDVEWCRKYKLKYKTVVDKEGKFRNTDSNFICINGKSIEYTILNPSGNITAIVLPYQKIDASEYKDITKEILRKNKQVEQVGFVVNDVYKGVIPMWKLVMSGGEFCANAARAFGAYYIHDQEKISSECKLMLSDKKAFHEKTLNKETFTPPSDNNEACESNNCHITCVQFKCSGFDGIIRVKNVKNEGNDYFSAQLIPDDNVGDKKIEDIVKNKSIKINEENIPLYIVKLEGITHVLIDKKFQSVILNENDVNNCIKNIISSVNLNEEKAVGVIFYDKNECQINPFVWVKDVDTIYNENACGSGSLAYTLMLHAKKHVVFEAKYEDNKDCEVTNIVKQKNNQAIKVHLWIVGDNKVIKDIVISGKTVLEKNKNAIEARKRIIDKIQSETPEKIKEIKQIRHVVKVGERSKEPIEIINSTQWYVRALQFKEDLLVLSNYINFHPAHLKNRLIQWIEGLNQDWCISRDRFFGIEIPNNYRMCFTAEDYGHRANDDFAKCQSRIFKPKIPLQQVFDTWFTSSSSPYICRENERLERSKGEYDNRLKSVTSLRPQAHEIIRTWTFSTMLKTYLMALTDNNNELFNERLKNENRIKDWLEKDLGEKFIIEKLIPWKDVMLSGWCLAKDGAKMSKSAGNVITPTSLIEEKGSDIVRYWSGSCSLGVDTAFNETKFLDGKKLMNKLINATKFATMHFEKQNLQLELLEDCLKYIDKTADKWMVSRLRNVILQYQKSFNAFEYSVAKNVIERLFWDEYCDNYLEIAKSRAYDNDKSALATLRILTEAFLLLFAPFMPHLCGKLYRTIFNKEVNKQGAFYSIFEGETIKLFDCKQAEDDMKIGLKIINFVRQKKSELKVSIKTPIKKLVVKKIPNTITSDIKNMLNIITIDEQENYNEDEIHLFM